MLLNLMSFEGTVFFSYTLKFCTLGTGGINHPQKDSETLEKTAWEIADSPLLEAFKDKFNTHPSTHQVCAKYSLICLGKCLADVSKSLLAL